jgi:hypothetical protein
MRLRWRGPPAGSALGGPPRHVCASARATTLSRRIEQRLSGVLFLAPDCRSRSRQANNAPIAARPASSTLDPAQKDPADRK